MVTIVSLATTKGTDCWMKMHLHTKFGFVSLKIIEISIMRKDTAAALYCEMLITRSVAMVTVISIAAIGSYFLGHVVYTYQIWVCHIMEWSRYRAPSNGTLYLTRLFMLCISSPGITFTLIRYPP